MAPPPGAPKPPIGKVKLNLGLWLVAHRLWLKRLLIWALTLLSVGLYAYTLGMVIGLVRSQPAHRSLVQQLTQDLIDYAALRQRRQPQPLQLSTVAVLPSGATRRDLAVRVTNPNLNFYLPRISYAFSQGGTTVASDVTFLLPGESKYLFSFGVAGVTSAVQASLTDVSWRRIQPEEFRRLREERVQVTVQQLSHLDRSQLGALGNQLGGQTSFVVGNRSIFGYWDLGLPVLLFNGEQLVAAQVSRVHQLPPGGQQRVVVSWPHALPVVTHASVIPELDPYDPNVFYSYRAPGALPR